WADLAGPERKDVPDEPPQLYSRRDPEGRRVPLVASLPHSGLYVPPAIGRLLTLEHRAWLRNTDWFLPDAYSFLPWLGVTMLEARHSRYVADLNRDPGGVLYGDFSRAVIARTTDHGTLIYSDPDAPQDFAGRITAYHAPYHAALRETLEEL